MWELSLQPSRLAAVQASPASLGRRVVAVGCADRSSKSKRSHPLTPWKLSSAALVLLLSSSDLAVAASYLLKTPTTPLASTGEIALRRAVPPSSLATAQVSQSVYDIECNDGISSHLILSCLASPWHSQQASLALDEIAFLLRIPQRKPWGRMKQFVGEAREALMG